MSFRIRPAGIEDLDAFYAMAKETGGGFTNLPIDIPALTEKLRLSARAFANEADAPGGDPYVFMLEQTETGAAIGTSQVFPRIGRQHPFYSYRITRLTRSSRDLEHRFDTEVLTLCTDFNDCSEVGGLFLRKEHRGSGLGLGALLTRSRYLFIRRNRERFAGRVVSELRGWLDGQGGSPFWDAIAGRFFGGMSFQEADAYNAKHGTQFIADLMPTAPIYVEMLSEAARKVMREPHDSGRVAKAMLESEGFTDQGYVDIFDGGPTMVASTDNIRTIRDARELAFAGVHSGSDGDRMLLAAGGLDDFVSTHGRVVAAVDGGATLDAESAALLGLKPGDSFLAIGR